MQLADSFRKKLRKKEIRAHSRWKNLALKVMGNTMAMASFLVNAPNQNRYLMMATKTIPIKTMIRLEERLVGRVFSHNTRLYMVKNIDSPSGFATVGYSEKDHYIEVDFPVAEIQWRLMKHQQQVEDSINLPVFG